MKNKGVKILTGSRVTEILEDGLNYLSNGKAETLREIDTVVLATGTKPNNALMERLRGKSFPIFVIGDAKEPRKAAAAIAEGAEVGRKI